MYACMYYYYYNLLIVYGVRSIKCWEWQKETRCKGISSFTSRSFWLLQSQKLAEMDKEIWVFPPSCRTKFKKGRRSSECIHLYNGRQSWRYPIFFRIEWQRCKEVHSGERSIWQTFMKWRNVIYELARFNSHKEIQDETVDSFVTDLFSLAEYCTYRHLHNEMIRDGLVVGLLDTSLSEKMQLEPP